MEPSRDTWPLYKRLLNFTKPYRKRLALGILFGVLYAPMNSAALLVIKQVWSSAFESSRAADWWQIASVLSLLPLVVCGRGIFNFLQTYLMNWVGLQVVNDLRVQLFAKLQTLSLDFFGEKRTGELISRITGDVGLVQSSITTVVEDVIKQPVTLLFLLGTLFYLEWRLTLASLVIFPICLLPVIMFGRKVRKATRAALQNQGTLTSVLHEAITGWRVIKVFCAEDREVQDFRELCNNQFRQRMRVARSRAGSEPIIEFVASIGVAAVCAYAYTHAMKGSEIVAFAFGLFMLYEPVKKISRIHLQMQESMSAAERVFDVLDQEPLVKDAPAARPLPSLRQGLRFENISFRYEPDRLVLEGVDVEVPSGSIVALVGASGSGKTTLLNMVPRFYDPVAGAVRVDGQDIRQVTLRSLREQIGLVTQETFLFNDTVAINIGYGKPTAAREEIISAAQRAHAHEFIMQLPAGYDTKIGEAGMKLSGGQRQRLAIARAILKSPPILLLDEATSALDTESERIVQAALDELMWGAEGARGRHTMLVIAHRLSTVQHADQIVVLDKGRVVERGTHTELLARGGTYKRLHDLQFNA